MCNPTFETDFTKNVGEPRCQKTIHSQVPVYTCLSPLLMMGQSDPSASTIQASTGAAPWGTRGAGAGSVLASDLRHSPLDGGEELAA